MFVCHVDDAGRRRQPLEFVEPRPLQQDPRDDVVVPADGDGHHREPALHAGVGPLLKLQDHWQPEERHRVRVHVQVHARPAEGVEEAEERLDGVPAARLVLHEHVRQPLARVVAWEVEAGEEAHPRLARRRAPRRLSVAALVVRAGDVHVVSPVHVVPLRVLAVPDARRGLAGVDDVRQHLRLERVRPALADGRVGEPGLDGLPVAGLRRVERAERRVRLAHEPRAVAEGRRLRVAAQDVEAVALDRGPTRTLAADAQRRRDRLAADEVLDSVGLVHDFSLSAEQYSMPSRRQ